MLLSTYVITTEDTLNPFPFPSKMFACLPHMACACSSKKSDDVDDFDKDPRGWSRDLDKHHDGEFSMAAVRANDVMEDYSQVETSNRAIFLGVYDGHRGIDTSEYISTNLFPNLLRRVQENNNDGDITENIMRQAVSETEEGFMSVVERGYHVKPELGEVGSSCLACYIWRDLVLYIANLGDSRAVICSEDINGKLQVEQLTTDHNLRYESIRDELRRLHPDDPLILFKNHRAWRVKGISKISKSIGDAYLKQLPFTTENADFPKFKPVPEPFRRGVISAEPEILSRLLIDENRFLIFASHGLWKFLSNQKAAQIVHKYPRSGIAKRLLRTALAKAAKKGGIRYKALQGRDNRRAFHDDITVIVVFFDQQKRGLRRDIEEKSYRGFAQTVAASNFGKCHS